MHILMFGWELPPHNSGGLGTACEGLTRAIAKRGHQITFVLPRKIPVNADWMTVVFADQSETNPLFLPALGAYLSDAEFQKLRNSLPPELAKNFSRNIQGEAIRYAAMAGEIAARVPHDIIHAHDWLTVMAGLAAKKVSGKPLVTHVHATETDRVGNQSPNPEIADIEKFGFAASDRLIPVSEFTAAKLEEIYDLSRRTMSPVHNGVDPRALPWFASHPLEAHHEIIVFVGRLTMQKGPDWFIKMAKKLVELRPQTIFVIAGSGDMEASMINDAAANGLAEHVVFAGFRRGVDLDAVYAMADAFVMPSVSEPFGIVALEAAAHGTPVIVSKQSGVAEVLKGARAIDFWDSELMASEIAEILADRQAAKAMAEQQHVSLQSLTWDHAAEKVEKIYTSLN